ncbi:unnamed protein product, partial [Meganyctiphanes norvegica]
MTHSKKFQAAVNIIISLPKDGPYQPSQEMMLKFYGLYKQATEGSCLDPKPAFYDIVKGYKWQAWYALGDMPKSDAMATYVENVKKIIETMSYTDDVANFIDVLGPFYEYVDVSGDPSIELEQPSSITSSPQHLAAQHVEHEELEDKLSEQVLVNNISDMPASVVQRLLSDTESDEEYLETDENIITVEQVATSSVSVNAQLVSQQDGVRRRT